MEIFRELMRIALPSMGSSLAYTLYSVVDLMWIGFIGPKAIASVTLAMSVLGLTYILNEIFGVSSMSVLTRRWGEGNKRDFERVVNQVIMYKVIAGVMVSVLTLVFVNSIMAWVGGKVPTDDAVSYYRWRASFLPVSFAIGTMMTSFRAIGDTRTLLKVNLLGSVLNILLDPIFMFWLEMGVSGSALASGMCEGISLILGLYLLRKKWGVRAPKIVRLDVGILKKILKLGTPALLDSLNWSVSNFAMVKLIALMGMEATAIFGIFARIVDVVWMMGFALEGAVTTLVGQSLGSGKKERARKVLKIGLLVGLMMGAGFFVFLFFFPHIVARFFSKDLSLVEKSSSFLRIFSPGFIAIFALNVVYGVLVGGGRTIDTFVIGLIGNWPVKMTLLSLAVFIAGRMSIVAISLSSTVYIMSLIGLWVVFKSGKWLETEV